MPRAILMFIEEFAPVVVPLLLLLLPALIQHLIYETALHFLGREAIIFQVAREAFGRP